MEQQQDFLTAIPKRIITVDSEILASLPQMPFLTSTRGVLFQSDCLDILSKMRDESIHCVFADPPFNLRKDYSNGHSDDLAEHEYLDWCHAWLLECLRVLVPGGSLFIYNIPKWLIDFGSFLMQHQMTFRHWIAISMKNTYPRGNNLYPAHYGLLYFTKGEPRIFHRIRTPIPTCRHCGKEIKDYGGHRDKLNDNGLNLTDFWEDTSPVRHRKYKTRVANELKPMIPERAISMSTNPGDIIFDPFGGGGSTYQVAERLDRNWIGTEIGACEPILERLSYQEHVHLGETLPSTLIEVFQTN
jgi:site-specific DNA-methyltransferase (adenine-specific)